MNSLVWGTPIQRMPVELTRERDLEYFDGPFIVVHRNAAEEPYLEVWLERVDQGDLSFDRWLLFRVSELELTKYEFRKRTLLETIHEARDGYCFIREFADGGRLLRISIMDMNDFPRDYLPGEDSYHDSALNPHFSGTRAEQLFLLDGDWEIDEFKDLERKYLQSYAFMGAFGSARLADDALAQKLRDHSFESGYNYKAAFDTLKSSLPVASRARMSAVIYSSPGFLRFRVDAAVADSLRLALRPFVEDPKDLWKRYDAAHRLVIDLGKLLQELFVETAEHKREIERHEQALVPLLQELANKLRVVDFPALKAAAGSVYVAGELLVTFVRRMQSLVDYARSGSAELAGIPTSPNED